jgi:oligopeptide/dipeptide ABC transporter ATP-binding protein
MNGLVEVRDLRKYFTQGSVFGKAVVKAVDGVNLTVQEGSTLGLVGESGCGKTTVGRTILRLIEPTAGKIMFDGRDISSADNREMKKLRSAMQIVFQDPFSSLNPRMTVEKIVSEPLTTHTSLRGADLRDRVSHLVEIVGLQVEHLKRYPHEFSGGQRQRIAIARAIALNPRFLILDEPTSSLDVSVQAQIINLLRELQSTYHMTYLFISHNLNVVHHVSNRISVMYLGKIVEEGPVTGVFENPKHPYTQGLISAIPVVQPRRTKKEIMILGDVPSPAHPPSGCRFHPRCPIAADLCKEKEPLLKEIEGDRSAACHFVKA